MNIYAQIIDDTKHRTIVAASSLDPEVRLELPYGGNKAAAALVGDVLGRRALSVGVRRVYFDRGRFKYHGRIKALADAAREAGLDF